MNSIIYNLALYEYKKPKSLQSHYYRYRNYLELPLSQFQNAHPISSETELQLAVELSQYGPLKQSDVEPSHRETLHRWDKVFPRDPHFYRMVLEQYELWKKFANRSVFEFISSEECQLWMRSRAKLKRKALFELETDYKKSKINFLKLESKVRQLLRNHPTISLSHLKQMGCKNAQAIWERFPQREKYLHLFIRSLQHKFSSE